MVRAGLDGHVIGLDGEWVDGGARDRCVSEWMKECLTEMDWKMMGEWLNESMEKLGREMMDT